MTFVKIKGKNTAADADAAFDFNLCEKVLRIINGRARKI